MSNKKTCEACGSIHGSFYVREDDNTGRFDPPATLCGFCSGHMDPKDWRRINDSVRVRRATAKPASRPPCDACGAESCASDAGYECSYEDGYYFCAKHWLESGVKNRELIVARRQRTAEPRFVDRNGVELKVGDTIRNDHPKGGGVVIVVESLDRAALRDGGYTIAKAKDSGYVASSLNELWTRIDPPADEGSFPDASIRQGEARGWVVAPSRYMLIDRLLGEAGYVPPPEGYGDFERDRVTRMVDAQAAMLARLERDLRMVAMLGSMFCRTAGDCEP